MRKKNLNVSSTVSHRTFSMIFIATLLWLICIQTSAYDFEVGGIYYSYNNGSTGSSVSVTYCTCGSYSSENVVIPETVTYKGKTYSVTSIGCDAFHDCTQLTSVTIPNSVTSIGRDAFSLRYRPSKVIVKDIGAWCKIQFEGGIASTLYLYSDETTEITELVIPDTVTSIGSYAFSGCSGLTSVTIPSSVTSIGEDAFEYCSGLTSVTIPNSVTSIDDYLFWYCTGLTSVSIPESVTSIGSSAFSNCTGLTSVSIPESVTSIGSYAFDDCSGLTSVSIPESVTRIGNHAFRDCTGLTSVTIPNSVTSIGREAFSGCSGLKSLTIGTRVQSIGIDVFGYSSRKVIPTKVIWLTNTPPTGYKYANGTINYVANDSYTGLSNVKKYPLLSSMFEVDGIKYIPVSLSERTCDAMDCNYNADGVVIGKEVNYKGITLAVKNVMPYVCYYNNNVKSVNLSFEGACGNTFFQGCSNITSVIWNLKDCVDFSSTNSPFAFSKDKITSFIIGDDVATIPAYICNGMRNLNSIAIPNKVTRIGSSAFTGCSGLNEVHIKDLSKWCDIYFGDANANPLSYAHRLYLKGEEIHNLTIPSEVTSIKSYAFCSCSGLISVTIPDNVTSIGSSAFRGCSNLKEATIGKGVTSIPNSAFQSSGLVSITIPDHVTSIGSSAFSNCSSLKEAIIGKGVTSIGNSAFQNSGLVSITIPSNITKTDSVAFQGCRNLKTLILKGGTDRELQIGNKAFSSCPLDSVYIGRNITYSTTSSNGYSPFYRNTTLRTVHITSKETEISENEFYGCTNLKNITIGDGVKTIGSYAFSGCSSLEYFACGTQVDSIGKEAFSDCTAMTTFRSKAATPPRCGQQALDDINKWECTLQVPRPSIEAYQGADQWKNFFFVETKPADKGDANGDDAISMADANAVVNYFLAKGTSQFIDDNFDEKAADVNNDGQVTMADANQIVNMFLEGEK